MPWISSEVCATNLRRKQCVYLSVIHCEGAKVAGHRGYYLTNDGIDLNQALISYGLDFLRKRGYKKVQPPFMMNKDVMAKTAQLDQFDEELYKVLAGTQIPILHISHGFPHRSSPARTRSISSRLRNNLSPPSTPMNGSKTQKRNSPYNTPVTRRVSERKQGQRGEICGVSSVCTSSKRSNSSASPSRKSRGICSRQWSQTLRHFIRALEFRIASWRSSRGR